MLISSCKFLMPRPHLKGKGMRNLQYEVSIYLDINDKATMPMSSYLDFCWITRYFQTFLRSCQCVPSGLGIGRQFSFLFFSHQTGSTLFWRLYIHSFFLLLNWNAKYQLKFYQLYSLHKTVKFTFFSHQTGKGVY